MMKIKKFIKENGIFLMVMLLIGFTFFNADARSFLNQQLLKTGLFSPDIETEQRILNSEDIVFKNDKGENVTLKSLEGKVVFINFWATWCPPCLAEMPSIQTFYETSKGKDIVFLMVDVDDNLKKAKKFMERKSYDLPVYTLASAIPENILNGSIPTTLILDKKGRKILLHAGMANYADKDFIHQIIKLAE